jgi:Do/DeqQ family serine protease
MNRQDYPQKEINSVWTKALTWGTLLCVGAGIGGAGVYKLSQSRWLSATSPVALASQTAEQAFKPPLMSSSENFITDVVDRVGPAVVRINASRTVSSQVPEIFNDPTFRQFFGGQIPQIPDKQVERGVGSGFIINTNGQIITNAHVVEGADEVTVTLRDGRTLKGQVVGADPLTDVAVVKVDGDNLPTVRLGDSDALKVGEWAIAIGNPLGLNNTVTTGIISAKDRSSSQVGITDKRVDFLQTDAAINPGNSGGPLLNAQGEVIGVNTAIIQRAQGLGFAIPINRAQAIAEELIAKGKVDHPYLGVSMAPLTPELKEELQASRNLQIPEQEGVIIVGVGRNSPAFRAGLRAGDVIKSIDGASINEPAQLQQRVQSTQVGDSLSLEVSRQGQILNLEVQVGSFPTKQS